MNPSGPIAVIIADDHAMVRAGLRRLLEGEDGVTVVAEAENGATTLESLQRHRCDVLMLDLTMPPPSGPELIARIRAELPALPILVVSMHSNARLARAALAAGANGYVTKDSEPEALVLALRQVARGERHVEPRLAHAMLTTPLPAPALHERLTPRERQVMQLLAAGHGNIEIARALQLSEKTVSAHKSNLMEKLGVNSLADLVRYFDRYLRVDNGT